MVNEVTVPDIGDFSEVEVIEVSVGVGDVIQAEDTLITLETDKAAMDIPAPVAGTVEKLHVAVGDKVSKGSLIISVGAAATESPPAEQPSAEKTVAEQPAAAQQTPAPVATGTGTGTTATTGRVGYAGPGIRRLARELEINLAEINGSGRGGRVTRADVTAYLKQQLAGKGAGGGLALEPAPVIDFAKFGAIERKPLSRIKKLSGAFLQRNWITIPHVTQHDTADITELEKFRKSQKAAAEKAGIKLTPLVFLMKGVITALKRFPHFNASLDADGAHLIYKNYFHIGVAVDTPDGLVVPVIRDVDQQGIFDLAAQLGVVSQTARDGKLTAQDMQGGCFTISSLGGIGGEAFTPIINAPEVAILGVSKATMQPVYQDGEFVPRLILPFSLSYDHRVIDGADAVRFTSFLSNQLADIRRLLL